MRFAISSAAIGLAFVASASAAHAQTIITPQPLVTVPASSTTVQTTETVRTVRPAPMRAARRQVVTTRTVTRQVVPASTVAATVPVTPQPLYDVVTTPLSNPDDTPALYDTAVPVSAGPAPVAAPYAGTQPFVYRYVYEPDRILVIDPNTGVAVQALPR